MSADDEDLSRVLRDTVLPKPRLVNGIPISYDIREAKPGAAEEKPAKDPIEKAIEDKTSEPPPPPKASVPERRPRVVTKPKEQRKMEEPKNDSPPPAPAPAPKSGQKITGKNALLRFKQEIGAGRIPVYLCSTGENVTMRELTVTDQKTLSKTALINNNRRDVLYNTQCSLINGCVLDEGFDVRNYTEFDRIVLLARLYQQNYFNNDVKFTCPKCGKENVYKLDFTKILEKLKAAYSEDKVYDMSYADKQFRFTVGWPKVSAVSDFYDNYYKQYQANNDKTRESIDRLSNVEYLVMFIKGIELFVGSETISLDLNDYTYDERTDVIDSLPQGLVFDDDSGVISKVISEFTDPLNKAFQYEKCQFCGAETEEGIGSIADFT